MATTTEPSIAVDANGSVFVAGVTLQSESTFGQVNTFPITSGTAFGPPPVNQIAAFLTKLSSDGSRLIYSTFLPGKLGTIGLPPGNAVAMAIDLGGNAYVTYQVDPSVPIQTTPGAFQNAPQNQSGAGVVLKVNPSGTSLAYATYLSGSETFPPFQEPHGAQDFPASIAVDAAGDAVIVGSTTAMAFPVTANAFQSTMKDQEFSGFVPKLNASGTGLAFSTYLGGSKTEQPTVVKLDSTGNAYIFGQTNSSDFPVTSGTFASGVRSGFVTELSADGSSLIYSIFVPNGATMNLDGVGNLYVAGTNAAATTPAFVERLAPGGVLSGMETFGEPAVLVNGQPANDTVTLIGVAPTDP